MSFDLPSGQILGFLGPNGAGKTTLIRCIMNILVPDSGDICIFGEKPNNKIRRKIGYIPEERGLYPDSTVLETLVYFAQLNGLDIESATAKARQYLERCQLGDIEKKKIRECSKGMSQKIQLGVALIHEPWLLILDEPFSGLDPINRVLVRDILLEENKKGITIMFSTHIMPQAEELCTSVVLINKGKLLVQGPMDQVKQQFYDGGYFVEGDFDNPKLSYHDIFPEGQGFAVYPKKVSSDDPLAQLSHEKRAKLLLEDMLKAGLMPTLFKRKIPSLDQIFLQAVQND